MNYDRMNIYRANRPVATKAQLESYISQNRDAYFNKDHPDHQAVVRTASRLAKGPAAEADAEDKKIFGDFGDGHIVVGPVEGRPR